MAKFHILMILAIVLVIQQTQSAPQSTSKHNRTRRRTGRKSNREPQATKPRNGMDPVVFTALLPNTFSEASLIEVQGELPEGVTEFSLVLGTGYDMNENDIPLHYHIGHHESVIKLHSVKGNDDNHHELYLITNKSGNVAVRFVNDVDGIALSLGDTFVSTINNLLHDTSEIKSVHILCAKPLPYVSVRIT